MLAYRLFNGFFEGQCALRKIHFNSEIRKFGRTFVEIKDEALQRYEASGQYALHEMPIFNIDTYYGDEEDYGQFTEELEGYTIYD